MKLWIGLWNFQMFINSPYFIIIRVNLHVIAQSCKYDGQVEKEQMIVERGGCLKKRSIHLSYQQRNRQDPINHTAHPPYKFIHVDSLIHKTSIFRHYHDNTMVY